MKKQQELPIYIKIHIKLGMIAEEHNHQQLCIINISDNDIHAVYKITAVPTYITLYTTLSTARLEQRFEKKKKKKKMNTTGIRNLFTQWEQS